MMKSCSYCSYADTVEPALKDLPIDHKKYGLTRQVVFGGRYNYMYIEM